MNQTQAQTTPAVFIGFLAGILAGKGLFGLDAGTWATILGALFAAGSGIWAAVASNKKGVSAAAASYSDTKVITDPATAASVPNPDVISNTDVKVVPK